jgi:CubicO group peptidase (beta-lactamase class C family)
MRQRESRDRLRAALIVACSVMAGTPTAGAASSAAAIEIGPPPGAELSREKLSRIDSFLNGEIAAGKLPGAIVLIQHQVQPVYFRCFGKRDVRTGTPMTADTIFPLHSVSKTITSVAAMMLIDQGKIALDDPVAKYIPSFANMRVGVEKRDSAGRPVLELVPLRRPITIEDLLLHTSGITYGFYGEGLVKAAYSNLYRGDFDNAEFVERLARLPLAEQPRTLWDYGHSVDVIGRIIEVVSGQTLYQFEKPNCSIRSGCPTRSSF